MMNPSEPTFDQSSVQQIFIEGVREIIGQAGVNAMLNINRKPDGAVQRDVALEFRLVDIQKSLESLYGPRGGCGVALRAGRSSFKYFLRTYGEQMGLSRLDYRLLPTQSRLKVGLQALASTFEDLYLGVINMKETDNVWEWTVKNCPLCWNPEQGLHGDEDEAACRCHLFVGMLQEFLSWASGGKYYHVVETACMSGGAAACVIQIEKQPLE